MASLMAGLLRQHGYDACPVSSGADLVRLLQGGGFDAVVLDVNLVGEDTSEVLRALQAQAEVPVILSSGYGEDDLAPELKGQPNVRGYLAKPYTADRLVDVLRRVGAPSVRPEESVG